MSEKWTWNDRELDGLNGDRDDDKDRARARGLMKRYDIEMR